VKWSRTTQSPLIDVRYRKQDLETLTESWKDNLVEKPEEKAQKNAENRQTGTAPSAVAIYRDASLSLGKNAIQGSDKDELSTKENFSDDGPPELEVERNHRPMAGVYILNFKTEDREIAEAGPQERI
jgi:hypothetical protein